jgi:hypothetical protein
MASPGAAKKDFAKPNGGQAGLRFALYSLLYTSKYTFLITKATSRIKPKNQGYH